MDRRVLGHCDCGLDHRRLLRCLVTKKLKGQIRVESGRGLDWSRLLKPAGRLPIPMFGLRPPGNGNSANKLEELAAGSGSSFRFSELSTQLSATLPTSTAHVVVASVVEVVVSAATAAIAVHLVVEAAAALHVTTKVAAHATATVEVTTRAVGEAVEAGAVEVVVIERSVVEVGILVVVVETTVTAMAAKVAATTAHIVGLLLGQRFLDRHALTAYSVELFNWSNKSNRDGQAGH